MKVQQVKRATRFSPQEASRRDLMVAWLIERISNLPTEALADLAALGKELAECQDEETFNEISATLREIVFPEIIGQVRRGAAGSTRSTEKLRTWARGLGASLKGARKAAGLTQSDLARKAGLPQSHISRIESGAHSPSRKTVERIANALGQPVRDFDPSGV